MNPQRKITHNGQTHTLKEWGEITGLNPETIRSRLDHQGYTIARALTEKTRVQFRPKKEQVIETIQACPKIIKHASGQACARWRFAGKRHIRYFGLWGSKDARDGYRRFVMEWGMMGEIGATKDVSRLLVIDLIEAYLKHVKKHYVKHGKRTSEFHANHSAMRYFGQTYGLLLVSEIKALHLRSIREQMIKDKLQRKTINAHVWRIARCFRWGVGNDLVPPDVAAVLESVENLQAGRTKAIESKPVRSVPIDIIEQTIPHLHADPKRCAVLEAMVRFLLAVGCRPGEMCSMVMKNLDRSEKTWCYSVIDHKNVHRDEHSEPKRFWIGPRGQELISPFLAYPGPRGRVWCFPPRGENGTVCTPINRNPFGEFIRLACDRVGVERWTPHQLRHNRATEVQRLYESNEAAAAIIGDTPLVAEKVYTDPNEAIAKRIALATG